MGSMHNDADSRASERQQARHLRKLSSFLFGLAVLAAITGLVPRAWLIPIGPLVGRPNAVTEEVHHRMMIVIGVFAFVLVVTGVVLTRWSTGIQSLGSEWSRERTRMRLSVGGSWKEILAITAAGAAIRGVYLTIPMAYDESYTFLNYARKSFVECIADYDSTNNHLLNSWIMHWLYRIGGPQEAVLRLGVYLAGVLLVPVTYAWAREWTEREGALLAAGLVAIAPGLITYSVDARGYTYVSLAAVCLDLAFRRQLAGSEFPRHWSVVGIVSAVLGLWAMPIMLYAVLGCSAAFAAGVWLRKTGDPLVIRNRLVSWIAHGTIVGVLVFILYVPAFVYRGLRFLQDPIMRPSQSQNLLTATWDSWCGAWTWWTAGPVPSLLWGVCVTAALIHWSKSRQVRLTWLCPFVVVAVINLLKSSAPPPRIYLLLTPWMAFAGAEGFTTLCRWCRCPKRLPGLLTAIVICCGIGAAARSPGLINPEERLLFLDVPAIVSAVQADQVSRANTRVRLMSPVPVDYPTRFYLEREQSQIMMNGVPEKGDLIYVVVIDGDQPIDTFGRSPINLPGWSVPDVVWEKIPIPPQRHDTGHLKLFRMR